LRRLLACLLVLALVGSGAALAGRGDPQEKLTAADTARARSMVLRKADLPRFASDPVPRRDEDFYCRAVDESDLMVTGEAVGPNLSWRLEAVRSAATVYRSLIDANTAWRRGSSKAGVECLRRSAVDEIKGTGTRLVSFEKRAAPRVVQRSLAFRFVFERPDNLRVFVDIVALQQSRAHVGLVFESLGGSVATRFVTSLARLVAGRMASAMRG
jgi:hypothetical protein